MADGIKPVHVLVGAGVALGALLLYSQAQARVPVGPTPPPPTPPTPPTTDPALDVARQAAAAAEATAIQSPAARPGLIALLEQNAATVRMQSPAAADAYLASAARIRAMNGGGMNPTPAVGPGFLAGIGDQVNVPPAVAGGAALPVPILPGTELVVQVRQANATDLQGDVVAVVFPGGGSNVQPPIPTVNFSRGLVTKVTRNGQVVAPMTATGQIRGRRW